MHMEVGNLLKRVFSMVCDKPITRIGDTFPRRHNLDRPRKATDFGIAGFCREIVKTDVGPFGDHQRMNACLRIDVTKGEGKLVFVDFVTWNLATKNFREDVAVIISHGGASLSGLVCSSVVVTWRGPRALRVLAFCGVWPVLSKLPQVRFRGLSIRPAGNRAHRRILRSSAVGVLRWLQSPSQRLLPRTSARFSPCRDRINGLCGYPRFRRAYTRRVALRWF
uniref:Uncharacterized protein n=1 Tax=uncultured alpha proteobacterium HF0010_30A23 TaxID=710802 RepID=E0XRK8_9PROT|nr:hypothetical protein [uncultured alpha proteobacterium HF0010_30A23]